MNDAAFMELALLEAEKGLGRTHPNPAVGAVLVQGGQVVATGFHARAGLPHAEAVALSAAGARARGATLYSTLEPCNHHGRTPPCTEAILAAGVARVVYGSSDPNPLVNGSGLRRLRAAGLEVVPHVLREEADALNEPFFKAMRTGLPWVTLKAGITLDGKLATERGRSKWITGPEARLAAHRLRDRADAVLVGAGTVRADDPRLTTRLPAPEVGRNAVRVVLDTELQCPARAALFDTREARTILVTRRGARPRKARALAARGVELWTAPARGDRLALRPLLERLAEAGLLHVLVEGGAAVHGAFLEAGLADELALFMAPRVFGHGGLTWSGGLAVKDPARAPDFEVRSVTAVGADWLIRARRAASSAG